MAKLVSDKDKISVAVIGVGHLGQWHARKLAALENAHLEAVVDIKPERAEKMAAELGCSAYETTEEFLSAKRKNPPVRAATVATPTSEHFGITSILLEAGIDVLVEKPLAADIGQAEGLVEKADSLGRILSVGHIERMNPAFRAARNKIKKPYLIESRRLAPFKERAKGVDVVRDLMIHDIDLAANIATWGAGNRAPTVVNAVGSSIITDKLDVARAHLRFDSGIEAFLLASRLHAAEVRELEVFDQLGCVHINCADRRAARYMPSAEGMVLEEIEVKQFDPLEEELKNFLHAVAARKPPIITGSDGLKSLATAIEIIEKIEGK